MTKIIIPTNTAMSPPSTHTGNLDVIVVVAVPLIRHYSNFEMTVVFSFGKISHEAMATTRLELPTFLFLTVIRNVLM